MPDNLATNDQIIALRLAAQHHLETEGGIRERERARSILLWANTALGDTRNAREARAICRRVIVDGDNYLTPAMRDTYARALVGAVLVVPLAPVDSERTAFASRGTQYGTNFVTVGVSVLGETCKINVPGSWDRVTALRFLEMHLATAIADVRALRAEIEDEGRPAATPEAVRP